MEVLTVRFSYIVFFLVLVVSTVFFFIDGCKKLALTPEAELIEVPPSERLPQERDSVMVIHDLKFSISSYFWQDFMPMIPPEGPPFYLHFRIEVKNNSGRPIKGLTALAATLYYLETQKIFHSFRLIPTANTQPAETILPKEGKTLIYTNDREEIFSPQTEQGTKFYGRIMVRWSGKTHLLTSPPAGVGYTF